MSDDVRGFLMSSHCVCMGICLCLLVVIDSASFRVMGGFFRDVWFCFVGAFIYTHSISIYMYIVLCNSL